jgi:peptidoglycan/xylan/chitin deacetylase (PgdA/CDA1 family)
LSQTELTGAESYALELAREHERRGHRVLIVSDGIHYDGTRAFIAQPISKRSYAQRVRNIRFLRRLIVQQQVDVVHAHSRAASWVSYFATLGTKVAYVSTVHGRQHLHASMYTKDVYGDRVFPVCEELRHHLVDELRMRRQKLAHVPNGFRFLRAPVSGERKVDGSTRTQIAVLGRTTGPKGQRLETLLRQVFPTLLDQYDSLDLLVAGGRRESLSAAGQEQLEFLERQYPGRIQFSGIVPHLDLCELMTRSSAVIGSGRIAIQALALGLPVYALGESCVPGWIDANNLDSGRASNFGDIVRRQSEIEFPIARVHADLQMALRNGLKFKPVDQQVREIYSVARVAETVEREYLHAIFRRHMPRWIPVLMYHKVEKVPIPSRHRIFISAERFAAHLRFFQRRQFTTLTFRDLNDFLMKRRPWTEWPRRPLILTFDDGYESTYQYAVPQLSRFGFKAVFFVLGAAAMKFNVWDTESGDEVPARLIGGREVLRLSQQGHEIGAHTMSHPRLTEISLESARQEIMASREALRQVIGQDVVSFAYPYGYLNSAIKDIVRDSGFGFAAATDTGGLHLSDDLFQIFRVSVFPEDGVWKIWKKTSTWYRRYYAWKRGK